MEILIALIAAFITLISSFVIQLIVQRRKKKARELTLKIAKSYGPFMDKLSDDYLKEIKERSEQLKIGTIQSKNYIREAYKNIFYNMIAHSTTYDTEKEIRLNIHKKLGDLQARINQIEHRFPADSTLDKIASINDAILAKNIETISESLKNIEKKLLSKWDVAKVVFQILAALGVLLGIIFTVIELVK